MAELRIGCLVMAAGSGSRSVGTAAWLVDS